jgi:hypothetical protein
LVVHAAGKQPDVPVFIAAENGEVRAFKGVNKRS